MSPIMTELYRTRPSWTALAPAARRQFLQDLLARLAPVLETGASAIAIGAAGDVANADTAGYCFFALWRLRDQAAAEDMIRISQAAGWYDYFETLTMVGERCDIADHLEQLIEA